MSVAWQEKLGIWQSWLLVAFMFFLPISSAAPNLLLLLILILWLVEGDFARKWQQMRAHPLLFPMMAYALLYPLSLWWTEDVAWGEHMVARHVIYLLFPVLLTVVRKEHLAYYLSAFIAAMTVSEVASYSVWFHLLQIPGIDPLDPAGFMGHWEYNPFLALATYLMGYALLFGQVSGWKRGLFIVFIITMSINMFITGGRIGQVAYFALLLLLFGQYFASRNLLWRGLGMSAVGLVAVFVLAYNTSSLFHERASLAVYEALHHDSTKTGSVNARFIYWQNTLVMSLERPFVGSGIGDFPQDYNRQVGAEAPIHMSTFGEGGGHSQPHNQYLFELASFGLLGVVVFVWLWRTIIVQAMRQHDMYTHIRWAFTILTLLIMLTDSYLLVQAFSYLFVLMLAMFWQPQVRSLTCEH
jgi:O-antigen ligase